MIRRIYMSSAPLAVIAYIFGFFIIYILCRIFIKPLKWFLRLLLSCILGCLAMLLANKLFYPLGVDFSINPLTAMISGVLGIPGIIMTYLLYGIL